MTLVACRLSHVMIDERSDHHAVIVAEIEGRRRFPIAIGGAEALAIDRALKGQRFPRPLTHDLLSVVFDATRAVLSEVRIVDLREGVFHAELVIDAGGGRKHIDCRPSDALALAVRRIGCALLVAEPVLAEACAG